MQPLARLAPTGKWIRSTGRANHYNSVIDPDKPAVGIGLGLPSYKVGTYSSQWLPPQWSLVRPMRALTRYATPARAMLADIGADRTYRMGQLAIGPLGGVSLGGVLERVRCEYTEWPQCEMSGQATVCNLSRLRCSSHLATG